MEQHSRPSADELGLSDVEYERIVRDVQRRHGPAAQTAWIPATTGDESPQSRHGLGLVVLATVALIALFWRVGATHHGPAYAFMETVNGHPVTYSSCQVVQVAVYPAGGPPDAEQLVREAVAKMRDATGLNIVVSGVFGGHAPNWNFKSAPVYPDDPISVSWQDGRAIAELTDEIAGIGGSRIMTGPNGSERFVAGTVALSRDYYATLAAQHDHAEALAVLLHEFGHVFGLDHVNSPDELMYKRNVGRTTFGEGDLEGLRMLGQGPCT